MAHGVVFQDRFYCNMAVASQRQGSLYCMVLMYNVHRGVRYFLETPTRRQRRRQVEDYI